MRAWVAVLALVVSVSSADEVIPGRTNCYITGREPEKPRALSFCHKFNDQSCCSPAMDEENNEMFSNLFDVGLSCRLRGDIRDHPVAKLYCLNCDPEQPKYVRPEPYVPLGGAWTLSSLCPNANTDEKKRNCEFEFPDGSSPVPGGWKRDKTILVCKDWAIKHFAAKDENSPPTIFDACGYKKSSPCLDSSGKIIPERDRYTCGDDLIFPGSTYASLEEFLNADSFATPQIDTSFGFRLVENRYCSDSELNALSTNAGDLDATGANVFNPRCLRTAQQMFTYKFSPYSAVSDPNFTLADLDDEKCFNSAGAVIPHMVLFSLLLLASALVAMGLL